MPGHVNEAAWDRAKALAHKYCKKHGIKIGSDRYWSIVQHIYQNIIKGGK